MTILELAQQDFGRMTPAESEEIRKALLSLDTTLATILGPAVDPWLVTARSPASVFHTLPFGTAALKLLRRCVMLAEAVLADSGSPPEKEARWLVKRNGESLGRESFSSQADAFRYAAAYLDNRMEPTLLLEGERITVEQE